VGALIEAAMQHCKIGSTIPGCASASQCISSNAFAMQVTESVPHDTPSVHDAVMQITNSGLVLQQ
jgi:hypothetical protein